MNQPTDGIASPWLRLPARGAKPASSATPQRGAAPDPWAVDTRPCLYRSEGFAEDLDELYSLQAH